MFTSKTDWSGPASWSMAFPLERSCLELSRQRGVRHEPNINAPILRATICGLVGLNRLVLAKPNQIDLVGRHAVLRCQVLNDCIRAALAEVIVVGRATDRIRSTFDRDDVALGVGDIRRHLIQGFLGFLGEVVFIEAKVHRGLSDRTIVIQVGYGTRQGVHAVDCIVCEGLGFVGALSSSQGLRIDVSGLRLHGLDGGLCARVDVFDFFGILSSQVIQLIGLVDERGGFLADVVLGCATYRGKCSSDKNQGNEVLRSS